MLDLVPTAYTALAGQVTMMLEGEMIELTEKQRKELKGPAPLVVDPATKEEYVLLQRRVYERMRALVEDDSTVASAELVDRIMADDDANDPSLQSDQSFTRETST